MTIAKSQSKLTLPDHTQLPESDGTFVKDFQEHPRGLLLTSAIRPILDTLHADGQYCIGQDSGIYWRLIDPPERGAVTPDWFYVPNVPPLLNGRMRRSCVMWQEIVAPLIVIEFVSGDGSEERDATSPFAGDESNTGKFWVYEQAIRVPFYAIYEVEKASVEVYESVANRYQRCTQTVEVTIQFHRWEWSLASGRDSTLIRRCPGYAGGMIEGICCYQEMNAPSKKNNALNVWQSVCENWALIQIRFESLHTLN